jgi:hypothetical protein
VSWQASIDERSRWAWIPLFGPEIRFGLRVARHVVVDIGVAGMIMFPPDVRRAGTTDLDRNRGIRTTPLPDRVGVDGSEQIPGTLQLPQETALSTFVMIFPTIGARFEL